VCFFEDKADNSMIDFRLKSANEKIGGQNIGLCPGAYAGKGSIHNSLYLTETAFRVLEPSVRSHSLAYGRPYSHWGITTITRSEWRKILLDWDKLKAGIAAATTPEQVGAFFSSEKLKSEFQEEFEANKIGLLRMIDELNFWFRDELSSHDKISILGI
jgi:hypothetical protein